MTTLEATVKMTMIQCSECGVVFALSEAYNDARRRDHSTFYCPSGHMQYYPSETREEKLKRQLAATTDQLARTQASLETSRRSKAAIKGQLTKTKRRVANGVCPCCNRSFANLARHMHTQHPTYAEEASDG